MKNRRLGVFLYQIFLILARAAIHLATPFNSKAKKWVAGRKNLFEKMAGAIQPGSPVIWMHCASLGEFEQGRPVLEQLRRRYPGHRALVTFFSPSGYEVRHNYPGADWVFYLPFDGLVRSRRFLDIVQPSLALFVKYEYWYFYLRNLQRREIPAALVSGIFRPSSPFFKWYGGLHRRMLGCFRVLFVQDQRSLDLLAGIGLGDKTLVTGDTRFDRVSEVAGAFQPVEGIADFLSGTPCLVAGSTWPEDEEMLSRVFAETEQPGLKLLLAPHELGDAHLARLAELFPGSLRYSQLAAKPTGAEARVLIIDNMGMLSRLYGHGYLTYVGGGLKPTGVHNVLEAAVFSRPVIMGPYFAEYLEAIELHGAGGATVINSAEELQTLLGRMLANQGDGYNRSARAAGEYVKSKRGATQKILDYIEAKRLLTS